MPAWLGSIIKFLIDFGIKKIVPLIDKFKRILAINSQVNKETETFEELRREAKIWLAQNGNKPLPEDLEKRLRDAATKRATGLQ